MKQEDFLSAIKKQQSLIRKLLANRKRRSEVIDELAKERYGHIVGKFFKAGGERFDGCLGRTYLIAAVHGNLKDDATDDVVVSIECRYVLASSVPPGFVIETDRTSDNIGFYTDTFSFSADEDIDDILAPLYIDEVKAAKEVSEIYSKWVHKFWKVG